MYFRLLLSAMAVAVAALLLPAPAANAATPLTAAITCDSATNTISTRISGTAAPNYSYNVKFQVYSGSYVTTGGVIGSVPAVGGSVTVPASTGPDGMLSADGYTRTWQADAYAFYTETVRVLLLNSSGSPVMQRDATCSRDVRTTATLTCDQDAHTITATTAGTGFAPNASVHIEYNWSTTQQTSAGSPRFTSGNLGSGPQLVHSAPTSAAGTWSDTGYVHPVTIDPYYLSEQVDVVLRDVGRSNLVIGRASAHCVYADHGA